VSGSSGAAYMRLHVRPIARSLSIDSGLASCQVSSSVGSTGIHGSGQQRVPGSRTDPVGPCTGSPPRGRNCQSPGVRCDLHALRQACAWANSLWCLLRLSNSAVAALLDRPKAAALSVLRRRGCHGKFDALLAHASLLKLSLGPRGNPGTPSICAALNVRDDIPVSVRTGGCGHRRLTPIASYGPTERSIGVSDGEVCAMGLVVRTDSDREGRSRTWGSLPQ